MNKMIKVEVAYARPDQQDIVSVDVPSGSTIERAIKESGILEIYPEIDLHKQNVGVFSQARLLSDEVKAGERIEIYRPLIADPKEARRRKATQVKPR